MFVAIRDLRFAWGRFMLMGSVIALVAVLTVLLSGLAAGLVDSGVSGLRAMPLTHIAFEPKTDSTFSRSTLDAATLKSLEAEPGIQAEPLGLSLFNARSGEGASLSIALVGIQPNGFMAEGVVGGSRLGATPDGVIVSRAIADDGVKVGDVISLDRSPVRMRVVGIAPKATYGHVDLAYAPIELWRQASYGQVAGATLPPSAQGLASAASLKVAPGTDVSAIADRLGVEIVTKTQAYAGSPGYLAETTTMALIIDFLYVIAALIVGAFFTVWTIQRRHDIGLMKALGISNWAVLGDALGQVALVMVGATAVGTLIGYGLGSLITGGKVPFALELGTASTASLVLVIAGLFGSLVAVRRIVKVDPIIALGASQ